ncbi:MAG: ABC transporter permease [Sphingomonadales bacterium]|nr:ABC transporter permease [Sphingomonadales bacterium]MDE2167840.1 ABC transporter permease [Sphingomonadales bacterium]
MLVKESWQILRDPSTMLIAFVLPVILLLIFGYALNLDTGRTRIGLSLQDGGEAAASLAGDFRHSPWFSVVEVGDVPHLKDDLVAGTIRGIVVIPQDFSRMAARGGGDIQVITDGSLPNNAAFIAAYAEGVRQSWTAARAGHPASPPPLSLTLRYWFNPGSVSRFFLVPGAIAIVMTMIGSLLTALVLAREWERGTMEAILATPLGMGELLLTKVVPYYGLGLGATALCTLVSLLLFGVPFRGSVLALFLIASCYLFCALGQGLMISALARSQYVASQIALLAAFLPSLLLSGFIYEIASAPRWVQWITLIVPARYLIPSLQTVFLAGDDWGQFLPDMGKMLLFGAVFFLVTRWRMRRRVA